MAKGGAAFARAAAAAGPRVLVHWLLWELDAETTDASRDFEVDTGWDGATGTLSFIW